MGTPKGRSHASAREARHLAPFVADIYDIANPNAVELTWAIGYTRVRSPLMHPCGHTSGTGTQNGINLRVVQ